MANLGNLRSADYMALTRAMDVNGNHRLDKQEININYNAHNKIGNGNGVAGTREMATALENGDVFMNSISQETADKVAAYFSKRNENFDRPVAEWISDAWVSKDDFQFSEHAKNIIDVNGDNRVSRKELANALASGRLAIGKAAATGHNPFEKPAQNDPFKQPSQGRDPFQQPSQGRDPFQQQPTRPSRPVNDPFQNREQDSGAYMQIEMARSMSSDYQKSQILLEVAGQTNLSSREQQMLAETATRSVDSDYSATQILQKLAQNSGLNEHGAVSVAKAVREVDSEYSASQIINNLVNNQRLGDHAVKSVIISIMNFDSEYTQLTSLQNLINQQSLSNGAKQYLLQEVQNGFDSDYNKTQIYNALF